MCGEKVVPLVCTTCDMGSPPHVRGKGIVGICVVLPERITPAYAGKGCGDKVKHCFHEDHPRVCGEKMSNFSRCSFIMGSPPHVRGKAAAESLQIQRLRITPACAGKSHWSGSQAPRGWDHPRVCGEKDLTSGTQTLLQGSPPHVRGKGCTSGLAPVPPRITPACAGKRSGPLPAAVPAGPAGSCPASRPSQFPPRMTVISPRP